MTICIVIRCLKSEKKTENPVLLFSSDTQQSSSYLKRTVTKMRTIYGKAPKRFKSKWGILVASAGDALVIDEVLDDIAVLLQDQIKPGEPTPSLRLKSLRKEIGDLAYSIYKKYEERDYYDPPYFELLLGAADEFSTIMHVTNEGKQQILDYWGTIGQGRITGGELLLSELLKEDMTQKEAARLAVLVVSRIGNVDLSVGGEPQIRWCRNRRTWHYKEFNYRKIVRQAESTWESMKEIWWNM